MSPSLQLCPVCHELKSHLRDHVMRCGLERHEPTRNGIELVKILDDEKASR